MGGNRFQTHNFINSSILSSFTYDTVLGTLIVKMKNGTGYQYSGVPENVVDEFTKAESAGRYFSTVLAKSSYKFNKINVAP